MLRVNKVDISDNDNYSVGRSIGFNDNDDDAS